MRILTGLVLSAFLSSVAAAQCTTPCFAMFDDNVFLDNTSTSGNLILAVQFQPTVPVPAQRLEIFTGESEGTTTLSLWDHDTTTQLPGKLLASGSYQQSKTNDWQGANLDKTTVLLPNTTYWIGMEYQSSSQITARVFNKSGQIYTASRDGGKSWGQTYQNYDWKFRIYCCKKVSPVFASFGTPCGPKAFYPQLSGTALPAIGQTYNVDVRSGASAAPVVLTLGLSKSMWGPLALPFDLGVLGAPGCSLLCSAEFTAVGTIGSGGLASFPVGVPNDSRLLGVNYFHQGWVIATGANALNMVFSNGAEVVIGQ